MVEKFFLGSFSPQGFKTNFGEIIVEQDYRTIILKGSAGTGKSSLMKAVSKHFNENNISEFYCSSDPNSLDAVVLKDKKLIIVDGTSPHIFDPSFPAVKDKILNLGDFWDEEKLLQNREEIIHTTKEHKKLMERTQRYVKAVSSILSDTHSIASDAILTEKLDGFVLRLTKKLAIKKRNTTPKAFSRQLSALTPKGYITHTQQLKSFETYILHDNLFAGSDKILKKLSDFFLSKGYDVILSCSNLFSQPIYEHILVPQLGLAFLSSNPLTGLNLSDAKIINTHRFYDKQALAMRKSRLKLNKKACTELVTEAQLTMQNALILHNSLEKYYISAMDFSRVNQATQQIISQLL